MNKMDKKIKLEDIPLTTANFFKVFETMDYKEDPFADLYDTKTKYTLHAVQQIAIKYAEYCLKRKLLDNNFN